MLIRIRRNTGAPDAASEANWHSRKCYCADGMPVASFRRTSCGCVPGETLLGFLPSLHHASTPDLPEMYARRQTKTRNQGSGLTGGNLRESARSFRRKCAPFESSPHAPRQEPILVPRWWAGPIFTVLFPVFVSIFFVWLVYFIFYFMFLLLFLLL